MVTFLVRCGTGFEGMKGHCEVEATGEGGLPGPREDVGSGGVNRSTDKLCTVYAKAHVPADAE